MRKVLAGLTSLALITGAAAAMAPSATGSPHRPAPAQSAPVDRAPATAGVDDLPNPLEAKRRALRQEAVSNVVTGRTKAVSRNGSVVAKVGRKAGPTTAASSRSAKAGAKATGTVDQYVELQREKTDKIFVILAEFGNTRDPKYPDQDTDPSTPGPTRFDGPLHNQIPAPDRSKDNSTVWQKNYSRQHYQDLYFGTSGDSVKTYYQTESSGRYSVDGEVSDWVKVKYNEARYGRSDGYPCSSNVCSNTWDLVRDAVNQWVADQKAKGRTTAQIKADLATYDQWDRYDYDGDGNFNEPDGYLDHFQIVHAGGDQADGDPIQGEDAIWSHRWYAYGTDAGSTGPAQNKLGGTQIGDTGLWVGDYTIQPENGGLSVFVHEYGHDLGLPDDYDTTGAGDNATEYWTLMAQSRLNAAGEALGTKPGDIGAWQKLQLGWLDYEVGVAGQAKTVDLGPAEYNSAKAQALVTVLPQKQVTRQLGTPYAGQRMWWSGSGDNLNNSMTVPLDLRTASSASLTFKTRYAIEQDYDYLYVQYSTDGGTNWTSLDGTVDGKAFPKDSSGTPALTGDSAGTGWHDASVSLAALAGKQTKFRFLYRTDGGVAEAGFFADDLTLRWGSSSFVDGAETPPGPWTLDGFSSTTGTEVDDYDNFYIATNRSYVSYDQYLATGPYNFGFPDKPDFVEHYKYQTGLLVTYWDTSQADNNVSEHPGEGLSLAIDSRPKTMYSLAGRPWRTRIQMYDAPFSLHKSDSMTLHDAGTTSYVRGQGAQPVFDDTKTWWYADLPNHGVKTPKAGVKLTVVSENGTSMRVRLSAK